MHLSDLSKYLNDLLNVKQIKDYCTNGLQVSRQNQNVAKIALAVTASHAAIQEAAKLGADALIVHHGYFWKGEPDVLTSMKYQRIRALMEADMALLAYHLPLDVHLELGNNIELAKVLNFQVREFIRPDQVLPLLALGELEEPMSLEALGQHCQKRLEREPTLLSGGHHFIKTIAWCTGAAQDFIHAAKQAGADAYISGEVSERTFYEARELGIHYLACGHHATERYGIQALGQHLERQFGFGVHFIDSDNPV